MWAGKYSFIVNRDGSSPHNLRYGPACRPFVLSKLLIDVFGFILRNFPGFGLPLLMNWDPNILDSKLGSEIGFFLRVDPFKVPISGRFWAHTFSQPKLEEKGKLLLMFSSCF